jgi:hypothetical protein
MAGDEGKQQRANRRDQGNLRSFRLVSAWVGNLVLYGGASSSSWLFLGVWVFVFCVFLASLFSSSFRLWHILHPFIT